MIPIWIEFAENALGGIAVGRKNWLFAGADCGGERAYGDVFVARDRQA